MSTYDKKGLMGQDLYFSLFCVVYSSSIGLEEATILQSQKMKERKTIIEI